MGNEMRQRGNEALRYKWLRHVAREWCMAKVIEMHGFRLSAQAGLTTYLKEDICNKEEEDCKEISKKLSVILAIKRDI